MTDSRTSWVKHLARVANPLAMPAVYTVFTLLVYWQLWTPIEGGHGSWRYDPRYEYWQDLQFWARTWRDGTLALWNPFDRAGFPLYGDPQPGLFYPLNWPFMAVGAVADSVPYWAIGCKILGHWVLGAVGMHCFARRLRLGEPSAYLAGLVFSFTSPKLMYAGSALNWSVAWIPWVVLAVERFSAKPDWRRATVLGSTMAMVLLAGAPAVVLYILLIAAPFALFRLGPGWRTQWRCRLGGLAIAAAVCALWWAPLVAGNLEQVPESVRSARDLSFVGDSVFAPNSLIGYLVPRLGGAECYIGLTLLLLAFVAIVKTKNRLALVFLGVACLGILLALGNNTSVLPALASSAAPFTWFRRAHRYLYVASFAWAILGAIGLHSLIRSDGHDERGDEQRRRNGRTLTVIGSAILVILATSFVVATAIGRGPKGDGFALATVSAAFATVLVRWVARGTATVRRRCAQVLVVFVALDLWVANALIVRDGMVANPETNRDAVVNTLDDVARNWRLYDLDFLQYRPGTRLAVRDFGGYEDDPLGLSRYRRFADRAQRSTHLLRHANVRYLLVGDKPRQGRPALPLQSFTPLGPGVYEIPDPAPAVFWVASPAVVGGPADALTALTKIEPGRGAVLELPHQPASPSATAETVTAGTITELLPNRVVARISTPGPGWIIVNEAYYPHWRATVDGQTAPIVPANALFRAVPVASAGDHTIVMTLEPKTFRWLLPGFSVAIGLFFFASFVRRSKSIH